MCEMFDKYKKAVTRKCNGLKYAIEPIYSATTTTFTVAMTS